MIVCIVINGCVKHSNLSRKKYHWNCLLRRLNRRRRWLELTDLRVSFWKGVARANNDERRRARPAGVGRVVASWRRLDDSIFFRCAACYAYVKMDAQNGRCRYIYSLHALVICSGVGGICAANWINAARRRRLSSWATAGSICQRSPPIDPISYDLINV